MHNDDTGLGSTTQNLLCPLEKATIANKACSDVSQCHCGAKTTTEAEPSLGFYEKGLSHGQAPAVPIVPSFFSSPDEFTDSFPPMPNDSLPTTLAIWTTYLEAHKMLVEIQSGERGVSILELKDASAFIRTLDGVSELGNHVANCCSAGVMSQQGHFQFDISCSLFAFTMVLKGCELAEQISLTVLGRCEPDPSTALDAIATNDDTKSVPERIAGLIRLDFQLLQINRVLTRYINLTKEQGIPFSVSISYSQSRLLQLHNQIRSAVDSLSPSWT